MYFNYQYICLHINRQYAHVPKWPLLVNKMLCINSSNVNIKYHRYLLDKKCDKNGTSGGKPERSKTHSWKMSRNFVTLCYYLLNSKSLININTFFRLCFGNIPVKYHQNRLYQTQNRFTLTMCFRRVTSLPPIIPSLSISSCIDR